jgi:hypothetical protein
MRDDDSEPRPVWMSPLITQGASVFDWVSNPPGWLVQEAPTRPIGTGGSVFSIQ